MGSVSDDEEAPVTSRRRRASLSDRGRGKRRHTLADSSDDDDEDFDGDASESKGSGSSEDGKPAAEDSRNVYSSSRMKEALLSLKLCLDPEPGKSDSCETWDEVLSSKYRLDTIDHIKGAHDIVEHQDSDKTTLEMKCLLVEAARQACLKKDKELAQRLFKRNAKANKKELLTQYLTSEWVKRSISHLKSNPSSNPTESMHVVLLKTVMEFMVDAFVISSAKMLKVLKDKQDCDWEQSVKDVLKVAQSNRIHVLIVAATKARDHINRMKNPDPAAGAQAPAAPARAASDASAAAGAADSLAAKMKKQSEARRNRLKAATAARFATTAVLSTSSAPPAAPRLGQKSSAMQQTPNPPVADPSQWGSKGLEMKEMKIGEYEKKFKNEDPRQPENEWGGKPGEPLPKWEPPAPVEKFTKTDPEVHNHKNNSRQQNERSRYRSQNEEEREAAKKIDLEAAKHLIPADLGTKIAAPTLPPKPSENSFGSFSRPHASTVANRPEPADASNSSRRLNHNDEFSNASTTTTRSGRDNQTGAERGGNFDGREYASNNFKRSPQDDPHGRPFDDRKRPRRDDGRPNIPVQDIPPPVGAPGNGRGRGRTLPAWMTSGQPPDGLVGGQSNNMNGDPMQPVNQGGGGGNWQNPRRERPPPPMHRERPPPPGNQGGGGGGNWQNPPSDSSRGGGRGRARTLPAWKTQSQHPDALGSHDNSNNNMNGEQPPPPAPQGFGGGPSGMESQGAGRGRGKNMTLPAWVTQSRG